MGTQPPALGPIGIGIGIPGPSSGPAYGGFVPANLSGLALWLRADLGITLVGSNVSLWSDQSGNGKNFSQGTASARPTWNASGVFAGQADLSFDGGDLLTHAGTIGNDTDWTLFIVMRQTTGGTVQRIANFSGTGGHAVYITAGNARGGVLHTVVVQDDGAYTLNTNEIWCYKRDNAAGTKATLHVNGTNQAIVNPNSVPAASAANAELGGYNSLAEYIGRLGEVILYSRALTTTEQRTVEAYMGSRYGILVA